MRKKIVLVENHPDSRDDRASIHLQNLGFDLEWRQPCHGDTLEIPIDDVGGSIIFGGAQNVDEQERFPYLNSEIRWIEKCIEDNIPLLGLCLGGQLIAHALGAKVGPHEEGLQEFGYYPISPVNVGQDFLPKELYVMQCHQQGFDLPSGAQLLAQGDSYPNQAFRFGKSAYAFQFHPECTLSILHRWQNSEWAPWNKLGTQTREEQNALALQHDPLMHRWFINFLNSLFRIATVEN